MRIIAFLSGAAIAALSSVGTSVSAQPAPAASAPAVDPEQLRAFGRSIVDAVNADSASRRRWAEQHSSSKEGGIGVDGVDRMLADIAGKSKGASFVSAGHGGRWVQVEIKAANGKTGKLLLLTDPDAPDKIVRFNAYARPSAYPTPLIDKPVSRDELQKAINDRLQFAAGRDEFSGAVLVMKGDEIVYAGAFGQAEKNFGVQNTLDTRFHTGSMDKMFTAVLIGQLIEQKKLTLDTRIIDVLPDYPNQDAARKITIRHLLSHSSGVASSFGGPESDRLKPYARVSELLPAFAGKPLDFEPGTSASYSNEGFILLGAIIEKLRDASYYDVVQRGIFERAGMRNTVYYRIDEIAPLRAVGYRFPDDDFLGFGERISNWSFMGMGYRGNSCGGSFSTVRDMTLFLKALRGYKLLSRGLTEQMTDLQKGYDDYGYGFLHRKVGGKSVRGHTGGGAFSGINGISRMVWETGYSVVVMGNYDAPLIEWVGDDIVKMVAAQT